MTKVPSGIPCHPLYLSVVMSDKGPISNTLPTPIQYLSVFGVTLHPVLPCLAQVEKIQWD